MPPPNMPLQHKGSVGLEAIDNLQMQKEALLSFSYLKKAETSEK